MSGANSSQLMNTAIDVIPVIFFYDRISAGELAAYNTQSIFDITTAQSKFVTRTELHDVAQTIIRQHQSDSEGEYQLSDLSLDCYYIFMEVSVICVTGFTVCDKLIKSAVIVLVYRSTLLTTCVFILIVDPSIDKRKYSNRYHYCT